MKTINSPEVRSRLNELATANGGCLTPDAVWQDARDNPDGPLHGLFKWDLADAAHEYWVARARDIIRSVTIVVEVEEHTLYPSAPYWVHDPDQNQNDPGYIRVSDARTDHAKARGVIDYECGQALAAIRRAYRVGDALGVHSVISRILRMIERLQNEIRQ